MNASLLPVLDPAVRWAARGGHQLFGWGSYRPSLC